MSEKQFPVLTLFEIPDVLSIFLTDIVMGDFLEQETKLKGRILRSLWLCSSFGYVSSFYFFLYFFLFFFL